MWKVLLNRTAATPKGTLRKGNFRQENLCDMSQGHEIFPKQDFLRAKFEMSIPKLASVLGQKNGLT